MAQLLRNFGKGFKKNEEKGQSLATMIIEVGSELVIGSHELRVAYIELTRSDVEQSLAVFSEGTAKCCSFWSEFSL